MAVLAVAHKTRAAERTCAHFGTVNVERCLERPPISHRLSFRFAAFRLSGDDRHHRHQEGCREAAHPTVAHAKVHPVSRIAYGQVSPFAGRVRLATYRCGPAEVRYAGPLTARDARGRLTIGAARCDLPVRRCPGQASYAEDFTCTSARERMSGWTWWPNLSIPRRKSSKVSMIPLTPEIIATSSSIRATEA